VLQPAQWQLSADGKRLVGHMTLRKPISDADSVEGRAGEPGGGAVGRGALGKFSIRPLFHIGKFLGGWRFSAVVASFVRRTNEVAQR